MWTSLETAGAADPSLASPKLSEMSWSSSLSQSMGIPGCHTFLREGSMAGFTLSRGGGP